MSAEPSGNCLGDSGYKQGETLRAQAVKTASTIRQVAAVAIALDNANRLVDNYKQQRDIADRSVKIAEAQQKQLRTVFYPRDEQFLAEFSTPEAIESVEVMGRRYGGRLASMVAGAFAKQLKELRCSASRYCTSATKKATQDLLMARSIGIANARVLGRNIAFAEYQARTDTNYNRRMQAVALGRGLMQQAANLYASASNGLAAAGQQLSGQLNSALEAFGYARREYQMANGTLGGSQSYLDVLAQGRQEYQSGQYPSGGNYAPAATSQSAWTPQFGDASSTNSFMSLSASDTFGGFDVASSWSLSQSNPQTAWTTGQAEKQMNEADVGNRDMARFGVMEYPVKGITGGSVTVSMGDFPLYYVDAYNPGDKPNFF